MKKLYFLAILNCVCLTGCVSTQLPIMPAIKYHKPIDFQVKNRAYLYWVEGKQHSAILYNHIDSDPSLMPALGDYFSMQKAEPKVNLYPAYGKAEQAIFITSLRDILVNNQVFSAVEITAVPNKIPAGAALLNIKFKTTKQSIDKITLTVDFEIVSAKPHFKRTYLVESDPKNPTLTLQQTSVSEKLAAKIILALQQWQAIK